VIWAVNYQNHGIAHLLKQHCMPLDTTIALELVLTIFAENVGGSRFVKSGLCVGIELLYELFDGQFERMSRVLCSRRLIFVLMSHRT